MAGSKAKTKPGNAGERASFGGSATFGKQITVSGNKKVSVSGGERGFLDMELRKLRGYDDWALFRLSKTEVLASGLTLQQAKKGINNLLAGAYIENGRIYTTRGTEIGIANNNR